MAGWLIYEAKISRLDAKLQVEVLRLARLQRQAMGSPFPPGLGLDLGGRRRDRRESLNPGNSPLDALNPWATWDSTLRQELGVSPQTPLFLWVQDPQGITLYQSPPGSDPSLEQDLSPAIPLPAPNLPQPRLRSSPPRPSFAQPNISHPQFRHHHSHYTSWRMVAVTLPDRQVILGVALQGVNQEMALIGNGFLLALPGVLLLVAGGSWILASRALAPLAALTSTLRTVTAQGLDRRLPTQALDRELTDLAQVINQMLERLERSFKQASRFSGDAAHELKTPLAIVQGQLERTLQEVESGSPLQERLGQLLDEVVRLGGIVRKLLLLSLADAGQMTLTRQPVNLGILVQELLEDLELLAPDLTVTQSLESALEVEGDGDLLTQVLQNLLSNAIKYNLPQGWITIEGRRQGNQVQIRVINASRDLAAADRDRLFQRFFRGDPARNRAEGTGLGLSLAWEISHAHGGSLVLEPPIPGQTAFCLTLPSQHPQGKSPSP